MISIATFINIDIFYLLAITLKNNDLLCVFIDRLFTERFNESLNN